MNILQIIQTNTSTLDTTMPLLWYLKKNDPEMNITLLYCTGSKNQVLRNSKFLHEFTKINSISQIDLADLLFDSTACKKVWRFIFGKSKDDSYSIKNILLNPVSFFLKFKFIYVGTSLRKKVENYFVNRWINTKKINKYIEPDLIFFDLRQKSRFPGRDSIYEYLYRLKKPTILLPHSPHDITPTSEITCFDELGEYFPSFAKYWIPFKFSKAHTKFPERKKDFLMFGYPAFDNEWIEFNKKAIDNRVNKTCLVMIRNFYHEGVKPPKGEYFTVSYETNIKFLNDIQDAFEKLDNTFKIIIKPHPKASSPRVKDLINRTKIKNWEVSYESFYETLNKIDFVISTFTTSLLIPQFYGIPTIVFEDYVQRYVNKWEILSKIYKGLSLYCESSENLHDLILEATLKYNSEMDISHLRAYFSDQQLNKNRQTLQELTRITT
jgi:hypothetical protein